MATEQKKEEYQEYVKQNSPKTNLPLQMGKAFIMGGVICCIGQFIVNFAANNFGIDKETSASWCSMILILLSAVLTGFNLYGKLVKWVVASAIEYKTEGQVYGIGCKIFTIAGPVILYGIFTSWCLGVVYWVGKMMGLL